MAEDSTRDELETARRATQAVVHRHRGDLLSQSLLATLEYRLGHLDRAAARQRQVDDLLPAPGHCSLLARFEHARRVERRAADPSADERSPRIRVARRDGSDAIVAVELEVDGAAPSDLATDVLVESEGRPLGLIRIRPGPLEPGESVVFELRSDRPRPRADASLSLAHAGRLRGPETRWESAARYCPIVPDVAALPGWRPPVSSRP